MIKIYWTLQTKSKPSLQSTSPKTCATVWRSYSISSPWSGNFGGPSRQRSRNRSNDLSITLINNITMQLLINITPLLNPIVHKATSQLKVWTNNQTVSLALRSSKWSRVLASSLDLRKRLSMTFFSIYSKCARGTWWIFSSSARGYVLNMFGIHFPWTD